MKVLLAKSKVKWLLMAMLLLSEFVYAQRKKLAYQSPAILLEIGTKAAAYRGDLSEGYTKWDATFGIALRLNRGKRLNLYLEGYYGFLTGQDIFFEPSMDVQGISPNSFFRTSVLMVSPNVQYNIYKSKALTVYISQGLGLLRYEPKDANHEPLATQVETRLISETYTGNSIFLPTQLGIIYLVRSGFGIGLRGGFVNPMTDYLDNISELGSMAGNDNVLTWTATFLVPLEFSYGRRRRR